MRELSTVRVVLDNLVHMPHLDAPPEAPHPFVYFITIHNHSPQPVTILGRKWILTTGASNEKMIVEGEGVVGQTPRIAPGESFHYNSYHVIGSPTTASGAFYGKTPDGEWFHTRIPQFTMSPP